MGNFIATLQDEWATAGLKIRNLTRIDMLISIFLMILYTLWLFELPRDWEPINNPHLPFYWQATLEPRDYRVFCFFVYIFALLINGFQFFTAFLLFGTVQEVNGTKDRDDIISTIRYYVGLLFIINIISLCKFYLLLYYLEYSKLFTSLMTLPEFAFHTTEIIMLLLFSSELKKATVDIDSLSEMEKNELCVAGLNQVEVYKHPH